MVAYYVCSIVMQLIEMYAVSELCESERMKLAVLDITTSCRDQSDQLKRSVPVYRAVSSYREPPIHSSMEASTPYKDCKLLGCTNDYERTSLLVRLRHQSPEAGI